MSKETQKEIKEEEKVFTEKEVKDLMEKDRKDQEKKALWKKILNIFLWIIVLGWMALCVIDFIKVQNKKEPIFCLSNKTIETGTGTAKVCNGLGYKVYKYNCSTKSGSNYSGALEFGPFWTKSICDRVDEK